MIETNKLYCGDNMGIMRGLEHDSVDLIYCDPPYFTQKDWGDFDDRFDSMDDYISWLRIRMLYARRLLKPNGSIYVHLDWHAVHYVKVMMDDIFGYDNFRNEIIWSYKRRGRKTNHFQRSHNTIIVYSKTGEVIWNQMFVSLADSTIKRTGDKRQKDVFDDSGKRVKSIPIDDVSPGAPMRDVWDINIIAPVAKERNGYKTQKPEALLERIILSSSNPGDVVLDPFCGSGTTCAVAHRLGRQYIGIDKNPDAIKLCEKRIPDTYQQNLAVQYRCEVI